MSVYHVGCGIAHIYAGKLNKKGDMWIDKNAVTTEALKSVAQFLVQQDESFYFSMYGKRYIMSISEVENE